MSVLFSLFNYKSNTKSIAKLKQMIMFKYRLLFCSIKGPGVVKKSKNEKYFSKSNFEPYFPDYMIIQTFNPTNPTTRMWFFRLRIPLRSQDSTLTTTADVSET